MKFFTRFLAVFLAASVVLPLSLAFAEVKIELKNGRTIIADFCEESGGVLSCSKMGGMFDIDMKDIAHVGKISGGKGEANGEAPDEPTSQEGQTGGKRELKDGAAGDVAGGPERTIEEIRKRKSEIAPERENLLKEREKLQEDLKKAPDWMPVNQYEELQKRNAELDEKIKKYNEEVGRLNREEKNIVDESKKKKD